jgi:hypothetical protein
MGFPSLTLGATAMGFPSANLGAYSESDGVFLSEAISTRRNAVAVENAVQP